MKTFVHDLWESTENRTTLRVALCVYLAIPVILTGLVVYSIIQRGQLGGLAHRIQASRVEATLRACEEQNHRHNQTVAKLDMLIAKVPPDQRARAKASRDSTIALIDALVPVRDCDQVVDRIRLNR